MPKIEQRVERTIEVRHCAGSGRWRVAPIGRDAPSAQRAAGASGVHGWVAWIDERDDAVAYARARLADSGGGSLRIVVDGELEAAHAVSGNRPDPRRAGNGSAATFFWPPSRAAGIAASGT